MSTKQEYEEAIELIKNGGYPCFIWIDITEAQAEEIRLLLEERKQNLKIQYEAEIKRMDLYYRNSVVSMIYP
jgi:hypothetical protein